MVKFDDVKHLNNDAYFKDYPLSQEIWNDNYKAENENSVIESWHRIAKSAASVEDADKKKEVAEQFFDALEDFKFVPGGRIMANLGVKGREGTTLFNCFVDSVNDLKLIDCDSIDGIYDMLKRQAYTLKSEGGYGVNCSFIRPSGAYVYGIGARTPGPLKFMELWDKSSEIITQGSDKSIGERHADEKRKIRKGAQMLTMTCFSDTTMILTDKGWMNILHIILSDLPIYALCDDGQKYLIYNKIVNEPEQLYEVEAEDGTIIEVTGNHEFEVLNIETNEIYLKAIKDINPDLELLKIVHEDEK